MQAGVVSTVLETDRAGARRALTAIESISREALQEIRQALGVLRQGGLGQTVAAASLTTEIGALLEPLRDAIRVQEHCCGRRVPSDSFSAPARSAWLKADDG